MSTDGETEFLSREDFLATDWNIFLESQPVHGYATVMQAFAKAAAEWEAKGDSGKQNILKLLSSACSMMINATSINDPFKPFFQDFQEGCRSAIPEDFTPDKLDFFESILDDINDPWLKARLCDLLWLCRKPRNPEHARCAIESYVSLPISGETWRRDVDDCWERGGRLCLQIRDFDTLETIKSEVFAAFKADYPESKYMVLWLAKLLDDLGVDKDFRTEIAQRLFSFGKEYFEEKDYLGARDYLELAEKKYRQLNDEGGWLDSLVLIAESHEKEGDGRALGGYMAANSSYENAIQAYRRVPAKHRAAYDAERKIRGIRDKLSSSGEASLGEMGLITSPGIDISDLVESSVAHVSEKGGLEQALMFFSGLLDEPDYEQLKESSKKSIEDHPFMGMFGSSHMSSDGRVVAKTPSMNLGVGEDHPDNQAILNREMQQQFSIDVQLAVDGQILPALRQILIEYRVTRQFLTLLCHYSPLVPNDREGLVGTALWMGFERDFGNAIHLLSPQLENIVRVRLKEAGATTSNVDRDGIENENGLSTLMDLSESVDVFGENLVFEIKSVFTDSLGGNLRNEVAHGLLDDGDSINNYSIYAWWMMLRMVVRSLMGFHEDQSEPAGQES